MEYFPAFGLEFGANFGKYPIHGDSWMWMNPFFHIQISMIHHGACSLISGFFETPFLQKTANPGDTHRCCTTNLFQLQQISRMRYDLHHSESRWLATPKRWRFVRGHDKPTPMGVSSHPSFPGGIAGFCLAILPSLKLTVRI